MSEAVSGKSLSSFCNLLADILQIFIEFFICHMLSPRNIELWMISAEKVSSDEAVFMVYSKQL